MPAFYLTAIGAGLISAIVFASAATGPLAARFLLFLITPLPVFLAGLGTNWTAAALAGAVGAIAIGLIATPAVGLVFALSQALPAAILCYLALLNRPQLNTNPSLTPQSAPATTTTTPGLEWYPVGRLVLWAGIIAALMSLGSMLILAQDMEGLRDAIRTFLEKTIKQSGVPDGQSSPLAQVDIGVMTDVTLQLLPAVTAISIMVGLLLNLWLAGRITHASGRLARPWPDIAAMTYPPGTPIMLIAAIAIAYFAQGFVGIAAGALAGALYFAYVLIGLAIIHFVTRGEPWRPFVLWFLYMSLLFMNTFATLVLSFIGLGEPVSPLRRKQTSASNTKPPPGGKT